MASEIVKDELARKLDRLPEDQLREVLAFVDRLRTKEADHSPGNAGGDGSEGGPLLDLIGQMDEEPFASRIDEDLYGR